MSTPSPALHGLIQAATRRQLLSYDRVGPIRDLLIEASSPAEIREDLECIDEPEAVMLKELLPDDDLLLTAPYVRYACLGQGRLGETWLGAGPDGNLVSIKLVHPRRAAPGPAVELLLRDIKPLIGADVHYLVPYRAAYPAADGRAALVLDYVPGRDLNQRAQMKGPQSEPRALVTLRQISKGLHELAGLGALHGLLHPGNILLDADHRARIVDYGLVFGRTLQAMRPGFAPADLHLQTWAAPEQLGPTPQLLPASDLYSVGCLAYWLMTGQAPFTGNAEQVVLQHRGGVRPDVRRLAPAVSEITAKTVLKCMQVEPARRYPSPADLGRSLQRNLTRILPDDEESGPHLLAAGDSAALHLHLDDTSPTIVVDPDASALAPLSNDTPMDGHTPPQGAKAVHPPPAPVATPLPTPKPKNSLSFDDE